MRRMHSSSTSCCGASSRRIRMNLLRSLTASCSRRRTCSARAKRRRISMRRTHGAGSSSRALPAAAWTSCWKRSGRAFRCRSRRRRVSATQTSPGAPETRGALLDDELIALLQLRAQPGIGDVRGAELLARHGSAQAALDAARREQREPVGAAGWVARALETIDRLDIDVIACWDVRYPPLLGHLHDRPLVLFARGDRALLEQTTVAIVGTRRATEHGLDAAHTMSAGIARFGVTIVSGMALGIDTAAHRAALTVRGPTLAVLGAGIDVPYPRSNADLHEDIAERGLLVSEFLPGTPPDRPNFVRRNRIIAALAQAVLVVEAPVKSGALTTVEHALDLNREVLAVPGPIGRESCEGSNRLLRDGAAVALEPADV